MIQNITDCDSTIASKAERIPENIMMKSQAKGSEKERKIFERKMLFFLNVFSGVNILARKKMALFVNVDVLLVSLAASN